VKLDGLNRMSSRHCRMSRMGVLTSSAGTGTSTVVIASLQIAAAITDAATRTQLQQAGARPASSSYAR